MLVLLCGYKFNRIRQKNVLRKKNTVFKKYLLLAFTRYICVSGIEFVS